MPIKNIVYFLDLCLLKRAGKSPSDIIDVYASIIRSVLKYSCEVSHPDLTKEHLQVSAMNQAYPELNYIQIQIQNTKMFIYSTAKLLENEALSSRSREDQTVTKCSSCDLTKPSHKRSHLLPEKRIQSRVRNARHYEPLNVRTEKFKNSHINYGLFNFQDCM